MSDLKKIYSVSLQLARHEANEKVRDTTKCYSSLCDKESDYAVIIKSMLDLYVESAKIYNDAPNDITFEYEAF